MEPLLGVLGRSYPRCGVAARRIEAAETLWSAYYILYVGSEAKGPNCREQEPRVDCRGVCLRLMRQE